MSVLHVVVAGLMALVRWQDAVIAVLALFEWVYTNARPLESIAGQRGSTTNIRQWAATGIFFVLGALIAFSPQLLAWQLLYGSWLTIPTGEGFLQWTSPQILNVWFSTKRGLFTWTPLVLLAVAGFIPLYRRNKVLGSGAIVAFFLESYLTGLPNDWWGGEAFGARRFISMMPFFALGLAALFDWLAARWDLTALTRLAVPLLLALVVWNNLFILQYSLWLKGFGHISAQPTWQEITVDKFILPVQLLQKLGRGN